MSAKVEYLEGSIARIEMEIPEEKLREGEIQAFVEYKKNGGLNMKGFRRGKMTLEVAKRLFGKDIFLYQAASIVANEEYNKVIQEEALTVLAKPDFTILNEDRADGEPVIAQIKVQVLRVPELGAYRGIKAPMAEATVTEDEVSRYIAQEQDRNGRMVTVEGRGAEMGDIVTLDFEGYVDGEAFQGGTANDQTLELGSHSMIPGFEEGLVGAVTGEERNLDLTFPEGYSPELSGKPATFKCTIKNVQRKELPELDDEFAQDVSDCNTFEEYMEKVRQNLMDRKAAEVRRAFENAAVSRAIANTRFDVPKELIEERASSEYESMSRQYEQMGITMEMYAQANGMDDPTLRMLMRMQAEEEIRAEHVLQEIAKTEELTVSEEEVLETAKNEAARMGMDVEKLYEAYPNAEGAIRAGLLREKARQIIIDTAVVGEDEEPAEAEAQEAPAEEAQTGEGQE